MSDFQAVAIFIFALLMLSTYILNQFFKWQINHSHNQKLNFDPGIRGHMPKTYLLNGITFLREDSSN